MEKPKAGHINSFCILNYVMNLDQCFVKTLMCMFAFVCNDVVELPVYCVLSLCLDCAECLTCCEECNFNSSVGQGK